MERQPACRHCQSQVRTGTGSLCKLRGLRVRLDHLCDDFNFKQAGAKALTAEELESLHSIAPMTADGLSVWAKKNAKQ